VRGARLVRVLIIMNTTLSEIVDFWELHQDECDLSVDWAEADKLCWRCAQKRKLERCHIVPRALGGSEKPSNLVLLCGQCHAEAPNVTDPAFMWIWLRAHAATYYGTYWYQRGLQEYEFVYHAKPLANMGDDATILPRLNAVMQRYIQHSGVHWGQGRLNPATIAWVIRQVESAAGDDS
jgi:HNH endonuclease